ncbi:hypothetical protein FRC12_013361 [Ceratobasidium sp. 428]|nr:hypothetical protein FRC12_013361 [Ceratobasidium sp. 428]
MTTTNMHGGYNPARPCALHNSTTMTPLRAEPHLGAPATPTHLSSTAAYKMSAQALADFTPSYGSLLQRESKFTRFESYAHPRHATRLYKSNHNHPRKALNVAMPSLIHHPKAHNRPSCNAPPVRVDSHRAEERVALPGHSNAPVPPPPEPTSARQSRPVGAQQPKKRKPATLKFDDEGTTDEGPPGVKLKAPRKRRKNAIIDSPPPKLPGHRAAAARAASRSNDRGFRVKGDAANSLSQFLGVDPETATTRAISEKILSLSDHPASQVEAEARYTKVRGDSPAPLSPLSQKKGGYHRDTLIALGHPKPPNAKRPPPNKESGPSKRIRFDETLDSPALFNPAFRGDVLSLPSFTQRESASSTQRAVANAFGSQRQPTHASQPTERVGWLTPVPEPRRDIYSQPTRRVPSPAPRSRLPTTRASSPDSNTQPSNSRPPPPPVQPQVLVPGTPSRSPTPQPHPPKPPPTKPPPAKAPPAKAPPAKASRSGTCKPPPRKKPDTTTDSEADPDPRTAPKSKRHIRQTEVDHAGGRSSHAAAGPSSGHHQHTSRRHQARPAPPTRHNDAQAILDRLGDILNGGDSEGEGDDAVLDRVVELLQRRKRDKSSASSSRHRNQPSSSRHRDQPSSLRYHESQPSSSRHQSRPSTSRHARRHAALDNDDADDHARNKPHDTPALETGTDSASDHTRNGIYRYPGRRGKAASHAIPHLLSVAIRKGVYQDKNIYTHWADREYRRAWKKLYPGVKVRRPGKHLLGLMTIRISGLRTDVKKRVRPLMARLHKLKNPGSSNHQLEYNRAVCQRDLNADEDYYEHGHVFDVVSEAFFAQPDSPVILHHRDFAVMPLEAIAFVLTMMQDCLQEWDTGCLRARDNHFKQQRAVFDAHLHGLHTYMGTARRRLVGLQSEWFLAGMQHAGIHVVEGSQEHHADQEFCQPVAQACFIRPDSDSDPELSPEPLPELSPEPSLEPQYNEHGCRTAQSKGKGKLGDQSDAHWSDLDEGDFEQDHGY